MCDRSERPGRTSPGRALRATCKSTTRPTELAGEGRQGGAHRSGDGHEDREHRRLTASDRPTCSPSARTCPTLSNAVPITPLAAMSGIPMQRTTKGARASSYSCPSATGSTDGHHDGARSRDESRECRRPGENPARALDHAAAVCLCGESWEQGGRDRVRQHEQAEGDARRDAERGCRPLVRHGSKRDRARAVVGDRGERERVRSARRV